MSYTDDRIVTLRWLVCLSLIIIFENSENVGALTSYKSKTSTACTGTLYLCILILYF
jgi:hypothetical protein